MPPSADKNVKRKKPLSCAECRRLKLKCELVFPCAHCVKRGLASICPDGELVNGSRRTKILASTEDLHARIAALEEALKAATSPQHPLLEGGLYANRQEVQHRPKAERTLSGNAVSSSSRSRSTGPTTATANSTPESSGHPLDSPDALQSFSHLTIGDDPHVSRYYGAASSVYLSKRALHQPTDNHPHSHHSTSPLHHASLSSDPASDYTDFFPPYSSYSTSRLQLNDIIAQYLPPKEVGRALADIYFQIFGWFTNIVQPRTWEAQFLNHVYQDQTAQHPLGRPHPVKPQRLAVVLLIYALGALMDLSKPPHNDAARQYFTGARACLSLDPSHSVTYVQCIYLYGSYLMNGGTDTSGGDTFWPLLRMGMAVCEAIGLHRDGANWDLEESSAMERRIVFWEIHGYDVLQSIALGRGACIADRNIDCQIPVYETDSGFHCRAYALTKIWSRINEQQVRIKPWVYSEVSELDLAINNFEKDLPYHLSPAVPPSADDLLDPIHHKAAFQRNMLLLYINEAKLTLHRGWFIRTLKDCPAEPLASPFKQSYLCCLEACRAIVSLVRNMVVLQGQLIHRRWHFFFHLFAACVCLAAAVIRAPKSSLARSILVELEAGVALFKLTDREEFATVERLRENAVRAMQSSSSHGEETEDLDLLGARTTLKRDISGVIPHYPVPASSQPVGTSAVTAVMPMPGDAFGTFVPLNMPLYQTGADYYSAQPAFTDYMPPVTQLNENDLNAGTMEWNDFDMDAFLQEIGAM